VTFFSRELSSKSMTKGEDEVAAQQEDFGEVVDRIIREHEERLAEIPEKLAREPVAPPPYSQEMIDTREEFHERMRAKIRWLAENAPF
jgi:hypothetical protein